MFKHMTVPDITLTFHVETFKECPIIFGKFNSENSNIIRMCIYSVSENFLELFRKFIITNSKLLRVNIKGSSWEPMFWWHTSVFLKVSLSVFVNINWELFDFLDINKMEMYRVGIRSKVNDIKVVSLTNYICAIGTTHSIHHWNSINKHGLNITILIGNLKQSWEYFLSFLK